MCGSHQSLPVQIRAKHNRQTSDMGHLQHARGMFQRHFTIGAVRRICSQRGYGRLMPKPREGQKHAPVRRKPQKTPPPPPSPEHPAPHHVLRAVLTLRACDRMRSDKTGEEQPLWLKSRQKLALHMTACYALMDGGVNSNLKLVLKMFRPGGYSAHTGSTHSCSYWHRKKQKGQHTMAEHLHMRNFQLRSLRAVLSA